MYEIYIFHSKHGNYKKQSYTLQGQVSEFSFLNISSKLKCYVIISIFNKMTQVSYS